MIVRKKPHIPLTASARRTILPLIPAEAMVLLPGEVAAFEPTGPENQTFLDECRGTDKLVGVVSIYAGESGAGKFQLREVGTAARIISASEKQVATKSYILKGVKRIALQKIISRKPLLTAEIAFIEESTENDGDLNPLREEISDVIRQVSGINPFFSSDLAARIDPRSDDLGEWADMIAAEFKFPLRSKQKVLEALKREDRLKQVLDSLRIELECLGAENKMSSDVPVLSQDAGYPDHQQRFHNDAHRCGEDSAGQFIFRELRGRLSSIKGLPSEVRDRCLFEIERLSQLSSASTEYGSTKRYIDWLMAIPWEVTSTDDFNLDDIEKVIDQNYYGSGSIKKRILERIAIRKLTDYSSEGPVLCLAGVAGTGKASLAKAIAMALGKKFMRISIGGITDVADIKGTTRSFSGAVPGIIIRTLKDAGTSDPVVFIEDLDYFAEDINNALAMSLLEAIDPKLNCRFWDDYVGMPVDLSRVLFICAVKSSDDLPEVFSHRFETIELPGYIEKEKIHITRKYIIPNVLKKYGLSESDVLFSDNGLKKIIRNYTLEAGLLELRNRIQMICRHIAKEKAGNVKKVWMVNEKTVASFLGTARYLPEKPGESPEIGVAIGLAWTGQGGDLMIIEGLRMKGSGEVITTGSLGEVMKESIQAAHSYVRAKADVLGIDHGDFDNFDIHIHFPSGAIPKDGPSAGVAVSLVIASVMAERPIRNDIAMTGEVTLRGRVLQVGGLIEKVSAAYRAGIPKILIPKENKKDLKDLPPDILKKTRFIFIDSVDDVFAKGLMDFVPSTYTLEKLFADELKKAKSRKKSSPSKKVAARSRKRK
ncbi:MAG: endopeptidase La [Candidatus Zixiibacteriota bacterium]|nr:MAG: endopeptidase La [candidate division Zixibacteria bacterium]